MRSEKCKAVDVFPTTFTLSAVPETFHSGVSRTKMALIRQDYDEYRDRSGDFSETELARCGEGVEHDALHDRNLL